MMNLPRGSSEILTIGPRPRPFDMPGCLPHRESIISLIITGPDIEASFIGLQYSLSGHYVASLRAEDKPHKASYMISLTGSDVSLSGHLASLRAEDKPHRASYMISLTGPGVSLKEHQRIQSFYSHSRLSILL